MARWNHWISGIVNCYFCKSLYGRSWKHNFILYWALPIVFIIDFNILFSKAISVEYCYLILLNTKYRDCTRSKSSLVTTVITICLVINLKKQLLKLCRHFECGKCSGASFHSWKCFLVNQICLDKASLISAITPIFFSTCLTLKPILKLYSFCYSAWTSWLL